MIRYSLALAVVTLFLSFSVLGQTENQDYLPLTKKQLGNSFPVKYIGTVAHGEATNPDSKTEQALPGNLNIGPSGATLIKTSEDEDLVFTGSDKQHKPWSVQLGFSFECRFYEADIDKNDINDGLLLCPTGGNGLAPSRHLFAITFDESGRPVTFEADGYFDDSIEGVFDLLDLDRDGKAELLYMNFNDGYWITNLYTVKNARWQRVNGQHGHETFPLYTRFTNRENHKPAIPKRGRHPFAPDLSNTTPTLRGHLKSYTWAKLSSSEDILLQVRTAQGKEISSRPISWYSSFAVVVDGSDGRSIVTLSATESAIQSLLKRIVANQYEVELFGSRKREQSSPEMLWAHAR